MKKGDILFCVSVSGESKNILKAINYTKKLNNKVISITRTNSSLHLSSDICIDIPIFNYQIIEDYHHIITHFLKIYIEHLFSISDNRENNFYTNDLVFIKKMNARVATMIYNNENSLLENLHECINKKNNCDYLIIGVKNNGSNKLEITKILELCKHIDKVIEYNNIEDINKIKSL